MKWVIGLGNPGKAYENTRHNVGFKVVEACLHQWRAEPLPNRFQGHLFQALLPGTQERVFLVKPQTFMNRTGACVAPLLQFYQVTQKEDVLVIHDDLDLLPFALRIKKGGGAGGHNGLKSLIESLGKQHPVGSDFIRLRIGIGRPPGKQPPADYVLSKYSEEEAGDLKETLSLAVQATEWILSGRIPEAQTHFHSLCPGRNDGI